eukprot:5666739-Pyramimonas_sp.AAC.1
MVSFCPNLLRPICGQPLLGNGPSKGHQASSPKNYRAWPLIGPRAKRFHRRMSPQADQCNTGVEVHTTKICLPHACRPRCRQQQGTRPCADAWPWPANAR